MVKSSTVNLFLQWTQKQIDSLRHGRWTELDIENLIEELEDLGRSG